MIGLGSDKNIANTQTSNVHKPSWKAPINPPHPKKKYDNARIDLTLPLGCSSKIIWWMFYGISATFTAENFTHLMPKNSGFAGENRATWGL